MTTTVILRGALKMTTKRLTKSSTEKMLDGVCGGVANYFSVDPTIVRLVWILLSCLGGGGIIAYIIAMVIVPRDTDIYQQ
jgi:phage shock protein C